MTGQTVRVLTLNLWNEQGPAAARLQHCARQMTALQPDVVLLQEVSLGPRGNQAQVLADALGGVANVVQPVAPDAPIGNAVLSRWPVVESGAVALPSTAADPRNIVVAVLDTPHGTLAAASTHLSWELDVAVRREAQVVVVDQAVRRFASQLPRIVGGDFNCTPDSDVVRFMTGRASLAGTSTFWRDAFARRYPHEDGWTWARKNPFAAKYLELDRRIDYIFVEQAHPDGVGAIVEARVVLDVAGEDGAF